MSRLDEAMRAAAAAVEGELERLLDPAQPIPPRLLEPMRYAVLGAGKRLRPFLVAATGAAVEAPAAAIARVGAAIELVHCYSLVHDDLPAMDDAVLRRGRPACHRAFGEARAILAADALIALAFEVLARDDWPAAAATRAALVAGLGRASGALGMCGGQMLDLDATGVTLGEADLVRLQSLKTGALIRFALEAGLALGDAPAPVHAAIRTYAESLGLAFQVKDDLLDALGDEAQTGKTAGRDAALGRTTFVTLLGVAGAEKCLVRLRAEGSTALDTLAGSGTLLTELFDFVINRRH
jgi:farnesyl diphosphate synthase